MMRDADRHYLPAAGHDWALPFYDPLVRLLGADAARAVLIEQAALRSGQQVLDIGCGTGTLAVALKKAHPQVEVTALDPDRKALERAGRKSRGAQVVISFDRGFADRLPYAQDSFDRIFSSFMFHHLATEGQMQALREVRRVLKPGGSFHLLDFLTAPPGGHRGITRWFHSGHSVHGNSHDRLLQLLSKAGLADARQLQARTHLLGHLGYYQALRL